jgi:hypothetical protein
MEFFNVHCRRVLVNTTIRMRFQSAKVENFQNRLR